MISNSFNDSSDVHCHTRPSVIKVARSCCLESSADIACQDKLKNDIQLTHQQYMKIEMENNFLNSQLNDLDTQLKDQNYQYACLKYELEQINLQKSDLIGKLNKFPIAESVNQFQVVDSTNASVVPKTKSSKKSIVHAADSTKLPNAFCLCGVQLKSDQILKDHIRYHNNKAKFVCKICGVKTNGLNLLKHHMKRMHAVKDFPSSKGCRTCGMLFSTLEQLHEHRRREHGRKRKGENWELNELNSINIVSAYI